MQILTNSGKAFDAAWVLEAETRNGIQQLTMHLTGAEAMDTLASLVGQSQIIGVSDNGNRTTYDGYTLFRTLIVTPDGKALRLTLEREGAA